MTDSSETTLEAIGQSTGTISVGDVKFTDGFWQRWFETNRTVTIPHLLRQCEQNGQINNFLKAAGKMDGQFEGRFPFNDTDVYKTIEAIAYTLQSQPDPELQRYTDELIDKIADAQWGDGYLFTYYSIGQRQPEKRWTDMRSGHELYCAGHLIEAAVAYHRVTGNRKILEVARRFADLIDATFGPDKRITVPGHPEIELALVKLYNLTKDTRYIKLAKFFIDNRGNKNQRAELYGPTKQDHLPVTEQTEAVGHAVRAVYLYCGMADVVLAMGDNNDYVRALDRLWNNVVSKKMYLTGGIGSTEKDEAFGENYELPNETAYAETCAAIANAMWNWRMFLLRNEARYIDIFERVVYNGLLSGISLSGDRFFYVNPLASDKGYTRKEWFDCACCPPNIARFIASLPSCIYAVKDNTIYTNLFASSKGNITLQSGNVTITQQTNYPWDGKVRIEVHPEHKNQKFRLAIRIPCWATDKPVPSDLYRYIDSETNNVQLKIQKETIPLETERGYAILERIWDQPTVIELELPMKIRRVGAHPKVKANSNRVALERGPLVYCLEDTETANLEKLDQLVLADNTPLQAKFHEDLLGGIVAIEIGLRPLKKDSTAEKLTAIPYHLWANRGPSAMMVWLRQK